MNGKIVTEVKLEPIYSMGQEVYQRSQHLHVTEPEYYPPVGTKGIVVEVDLRWKTVIYRVSWLDDESTKEPHSWYIEEKCISDVWPCEILPYIKPVPKWDYQKYMKQFEEGVDWD